MNIEQKLDTQELCEEDYTKVYGGHGVNCSQTIDIVHALPEVPVPPDGQSIKL